MRLLRFLAFAILASLSCHSTAAKTEVDVPSAKRLALLLAENRQPRAARLIAIELLKRYPDDPEILTALSIAERGLGNFEAATRAGRQGYKAAQTGMQKFVAARATAQALASAGRHTLAQLWLRRAAHHAPNQQAKSSIRRDYSYVRSRNPWNFAFSGSVAPTDNANDAPTSNEIIIGGLFFSDPTALPIPGTQLTFSAQASYRLPATEHHHSQFSLSYYARRVSLGREAKTIDPTLRNHDFSADRVSLGWSARFRFGGITGILDTNARLFSDWNAGQHSQIGQLLTAGYTLPISKDQTVRFGAELENLNRIDRPIRSSLTKRLQLNWMKSRRNRDRVGLSITLSDTDSQSFAVAHKSAKVSAQYNFGKPLLALRLGAIAEASTVVFDTPLYSSERRRDQFVSVGLTATIPDLSFYGFEPVIELRHERNISNVSRFDTRSTAIGLSIKSSY